jgi:ribosomal protein S18 acetylase RimI-like enzyme
MDVQILHDKTLIFDFLQDNSGFQIYSIGDLDDFFWPKTIWYALKDTDTIRSIATLYIGMYPPTLLLFHNGDSSFSIQLIEQIKNLLPVRFNAHLSSGLLDVFGKHNVINYYGLDYKMILTKVAIDPSDNNIRKLTIADLPKIKDFFVVAYPNNWFDSRMIDTEKYYGYFINDKLVGVSGIHVYSKEYRVSALGNIATHPDYRGQQIGYKLTSVLCYDLQKSVDCIGLNVHSDNDYAIKCYKKIGFEIIGVYDECCIKNDFGQ